jgi:hypothetical protein
LEREPGIIFARLASRFSAGVVEAICGFGNNIYEAGENLLRKIKSKDLSLSDGKGFVEPILLATEQLIPALNERWEDEEHCAEVMRTLRSREFGGEVLSKRYNCLEGEEGVDPEICWHNVSRAALELAEHLATDGSGEDRMNEVAAAINNGTKDADGIFEYALRSLDEQMTNADGRRHDKMPAELLSPI